MKTLSQCLLDVFIIQGHPSSGSGGNGIHTSVTYSKYKKKKGKLHQSNCKVHLLKMLTILHNYVFHMDCDATFYLCPQCNKWIHCHNCPAAQWAAVTPVTRCGVAENKGVHIFRCGDGGKGVSGNVLQTCFSAMSLFICWLSC